MFAIQDEISLEITKNLKVKLLSERKFMIAKRHTENLEAYNLYLKGNYHSRMFTLDGYIRASEYYKQALQIDPDYPLANLGLAVLDVLGTFFGNVPPKAAFPRIKEYANMALKIDSNFAEAYWVLGGFELYYQWNMAEAERHYKHALQINPNSSLIHSDYSIFLTITGRNEEAISEAMRAKELDPLSVYIFAKTGDAFAFAGQYDKAIEEYQIALEINPNYFLAHFQLGFTYRMKGMHKEAIAEYEKAVDLSGGNPYLLALLVSNYYRIGKKDQADKLYVSLKKRVEIEYIPATSFYLIYKTRGEEKMALHWLKRACDEKDTFIPYYRANRFLIPEGSKYMALLKERGLDY